MKASVCLVLWQNHLGSSCDIVCFSLFLVTAEAAIMGGQYLKKKVTNLKHLHLQFILTERESFCSAFHEILAFRQNRAWVQEVCQCDLILL